jgi:hypothetical protein
VTTTLRPTSTAVTTEDQRNALAAPVRDPLWLLAREWQTGGFIADDGGTPLHVSLTQTLTPIATAGTPLQTPLEPLIEAEPPPAIENVGSATLVSYAAELLRRLREAGVPASGAAALRAAWAASYPLTTADTASPLAPVAARLPNPVNLFHILAPALGADGKGSFPAGLDLAPAGTAAQAAQTALRAWSVWLAQQVAPPGSTAAASVDPPAWNAQRLEYTVTTASGTPQGPLSLSAPDYDGLGLDWFSFEAATGTGTPPTGASQTIEVHAAPVAYPGMPRPRFWEFEDGDVNLDAMRASSDPAQALLATFAHAYANDWFIVALPDAPPGLLTVTDLTVRDTFGTSVSVPSVADIDAGNSTWQLWELGGGASAARGARVLLPVTPTLLEGAVLEDVLVARDEMANLAWVIELTTRDSDGATVDRYRRWLALRPPDDPSFRPADRASAASYRLGTTVPDFWYPLVTAAAAGAQPLLAIAELPPAATGVSDAGVRGVLINKTPGTQIADEEASRQGTRLMRRDRLVRTSGGARTWRARAKGAGQGEASSGLRFDVIE